MLSSLTEENIRLRKIPLLDVFMDNAAEGLGKRVQAVETARDQCRPLNRLSNEQVCSSSWINACMNCTQFRHIYRGDTHIHIILLYLSVQLYNYYSNIMCFACCKRVNYS